VTITDFPPGAHSVQFRGHRENVEAIAFSPDGKILATGSEDRTIQLCDAETATVLHVLHDHIAGVRALAFSPDGKTLASGDASGVVKLWHVATAKPLFDLPRAGESCTELVFSPDGSRLLCHFENDAVFEYRLRQDFEDDAVQPGKER
jgi:WD40 repeat protein